MPEADPPLAGNATENAIGRAGKIRYKMMRGFKSLGSAITTMLFLASLGGVLAQVPYSSLFS